MLKNCLLLLVGFGFALSSYGQGETNNWYFGEGAGLQFNTDGSVTALTDGKLNTFEGCSSISDSSGNLLFYTDGITVYNRNHVVMENGRNLYGDPSSTQSAIIVPKPDDSSIQYIFTVDTAIGDNDPDRGLNYSVVDLTQNNGDGAVVQKNINLLADCSEKVTAVVKSCFDRSIWVVTFASKNGNTVPFNTYHAFEVNTLGVNTTAVKSTFSDMINDHRGYLKFSIDGSKLASASSTENGLLLYDFDKNTGQLSNRQNIAINQTEQFAYGVEFSPSQEFLYVSTYNNQQPGGVDEHRAMLLQYDISAPDIAATEVVLDNRQLYRGALQLGSNGKIYRTTATDYFIGSSFLGVIDDPNEPGLAADYQHNVVSLNGKNATQGLPPFVQSFFDKLPIVKNPDGTLTSSNSLCEGEDIQLEIDLFPNATYLWAKDGAPIVNTTNQYEILNAGIYDSGIYSVEILLDDPEECPILGEALIEVSPLPTSETLSLTQCDTYNAFDDGITQFLFEELGLNKNFTYYIYESVLDRNNDNELNFTEPFINTSAFDQNLYYKAVNNAGCVNFGELQLHVQPIVLNAIPEHTFQVCDANNDDTALDGIFDLETIRQLFDASKQTNFYDNLDDVTFEVNPISGDYRTESTIIYARIENEGQCETIEQIELLVNPLPSFEFDTSFLWCTDGEPLELNAPIGFDTYIWTKIDGSSRVEYSTSPNITITEIGTYNLEAGYTYTYGSNTINCTENKEFTVLPSNIATINAIEIEDVSNNNSLTILVSGDGDYEYSIDGTTYQNSNYFDGVAPGFVTVYVQDKNDCGITDELVSVIGYPKVFTPNGDSANERWQVLGVNNQFQANSFITIYDRYGKLLTQLSPESEGWDGTFNGNQVPESDYWFSVSLEDGRIFKGHFALKR